jgi:murein DD-endopeptidase MepM/ murein hydrolase activator NlpD
MKAKTLTVITLLAVLALTLSGPATAEVEVGQAAIADLASSFPSAANYALQFNGQPNFVVVAQSPSINLGASMTIEFWIRTTASYGGPTWHDAQWILDKDIPGEVKQDWAVVIRFGRVVFNNGNPRGSRDQPLFGNRAINDGQWHHVAITRDASSGSTIIYIDGTRDVEGFFSTDDLSNTLPIYIGAENGASGPQARAFIGELDDLRLWNIARSDQDIRAHMFAPLIGNEPGLVGYWRFDEGTGQVAIDATSNHNDGQLGSSGVADTNDPLWVPSDILLISGRVLDSHGDPIQGVTVSAGSAGSAVTNASGYYTISGLPQGEYTLRPSKSGFRFEPETLNVTLSGNRTGQNFRGYNTACAAPLAEPFLRFPVDYSGRDFSQIIKDTDEGGLINSWFDHLSPLYTANYSITLYTGISYSQQRTGGPFFGSLYCYDRRCYDGHNGIDIVAPDPKHNPNPPVLAAAEGTVVRVVNSTTGYGKQVWIDHGNNYATLYGHLERIDVSVGQHVTAGQQLGLMGSTGASGGTHLHFGVYFNYNLRDPWITTTVEARPEEVVDPFGWLGQQNDLWGTPSVWIWQESAGENRYIGQSGGILNTSNVTAVIPAGSVYTDTLLSLTEAPVAGASAQLRNTGLSFLLRIISIVFGGSGEQSLSIAAAETLSAPVTITVSYAGASLRHLDPAHLAPYCYEEASGSWTEIAATVNSSDKTVTFQTDRTGDFSLQAPLLCPAESQEPDDHYMLAETLAVPGTASRLIDIADDEDWFTFDATAGQRYVLSTTSLANGVKPVIRLYDTDGVTLLASAEGWTSTLRWQAPADGKYFIQVSPAGDSIYGCEATYTLSLSKAMQVYLPLVLRNR